MSNIDINTQISNLDIKNVSDFSSLNNSYDLQNIKYVKKDDFIVILSDSNDFLFKIKFEDFDDFKNVITSTQIMELSLDVLQWNIGYKKDILDVLNNSQYFDSLFKSNYSNNFSDKKNIFITKLSDVVNDFLSSYSFSVNVKNKIVVSVFFYILDYLWTKDNDDLWNFFDSFINMSKWWFSVNNVFWLFNSNWEYTDLLIWLDNNLNLLTKKSDADLSTYSYWKIVWLLKWTSSDLDVDTILDSFSSVDKKILDSIISNGWIVDAINKFNIDRTKKTMIIDNTDEENIPIGVWWFLGFLWMWWKTISDFIQKTSPKIWNFVFSLFWFDWIEWFDKMKTTNKLNKLLNSDVSWYLKKLFDIYDDNGFMQTKQNISTTWWVDVDYIFSDLSDDEKNIIVNKIPDYSSVKSSLYSFFSSNKNIKLNSTYFLDDDTKKYVDWEWKIIDINKFVDSYLNFILKYIIKYDWVWKIDFSNTNFSKEDFILLVFWYIFAWDYFIKWMNYDYIWDLLNSSNLNNVSVLTTPIVNTTVDNYDILNTSINIDDLDLTSNLLDQKKYVDYLHKLEVDYSLPKFLLESVCKQESAWFLYKNWNIITSSVWAKWLFQFMPNTAKWVIKKLWLSISVDDFVNDPILSAKWAALYLKDLFSWWWFVVWLWKYNYWSWNISKKNIHDISSLKDNFSSLPVETKNYILKILYFMYDKKWIVCNAFSNISLSDLDCSNFSWNELNEVFDLTKTYSV